MNQGPLAELLVVHAMVAEDLEGHLARYARAGFAVGDARPVFPDGLAVGFITLWPQYVELLAVHDPQAFEAWSEDTPLHTGLRTLRPCSVELVSEDTLAMRRELIARGWDLPAPEETRLATTAADAPPDFVSVALPLPGVPVTCYTSTQIASLSRPIQVGRNSVFAMPEVTVVVDDPAAAQRSWSEITQPGAMAVRLMTAEQWRAESGHDERTGIVEVTLYAEDVECAHDRMLREGWELESSSTGDPVLRHAGDGIRYRLRAEEVEAWQARRAECNGVQLDIVRH